MRYVLVILLCVCCSLKSFGQKSRAEELLQGEPEAAQLRNIAGAQIGNWYTVIANESWRRQMMRDVMLGLSNRLYDDLLVCEGRCKEQDAREAEFWLLQSHLRAYNLTPFRDRSNAVPDSRWEMHDNRDFSIRDEVMEYCRKASGLDDNRGETIRVGGKIKFIEPDPVRRAEADRKDRACIKEFLALGETHAPSKAPSDSPLWDAHVTVWKACLTKYQPARGVFEQQPYDECMNRDDVDTRVCTARRAILKQPGRCIGPLPSDGDLKNLKNHSEAVEQSLMSESQKQGLLLDVQSVKKLEPRTSEFPPLDRQDDSRNYANLHLALDPAPAYVLVCSYKGWLKSQMFWYQSVPDRVPQLFADWPSGPFRELGYKALNACPPNLRAADQARSSVTSASGKELTQ